MFTRIVAAGVLACLLAGCAKKTAKTTVPDNPAPAPAPQVADRGKPGGSDKAGKNDKTRPDGNSPNWLNDPRFNKDNQLPPDGSSGKPGWGVKPPDGGWQPPNAPGPQPGNPGPAAGSPVPPRPGIGGPGASVPPAAGTPTQPTTGGKPVAEADMKDVWIYIENASGASGKMPTPDLVLAALLQAKSPAAALVRDGSIVLTNTRTRDSVWAYEAKAITQGGLVASQNGVETLTPAQLAGRLR